MATTIMAVFSDPASPEQEDEYNTWYDEVHLEELLGLPGVGGAVRYRIGESGPGEPGHRYVALYPLTEPVEDVLEQMGALGSRPSPAFDMAGSRIQFWTVINDRSGGAA